MYRGLSPHKFTPMPGYTIGYSRLRAQASKLAHVLAADLRRLYDLYESRIPLPKLVKFVVC